MQVIVSGGAAMDELSPYMQEAHERLAAEYERSARLRDLDPDAAWVAFSEFLDGLQRHMALEEEVLFPAFRARPLAGAQDALSAIREEHRRILKLLDELQVCQAEFNPRAQAVENELRLLLNDHHAAEERVFQPWLATVLTADERHALLDRLARFGIYIATAVTR